MTRRARLSLVLASSAAALAATLAFYFAGGESSVTHAALDQIRSLPYLSWTDVGEQDLRKSGLVHWDRERAWPGENVYCAEGRPGGWVLDMRGRAILAVPDPRPEPENCRLLEPDGDDGFLMLTVDRSLLRLGRDRQLLFARRQGFHHDAVRTAEGRYYALAEQVRRVPAINRLKPVIDNHLVVLDPRGQELDRISFAEMILADPELLRRVKARRGRQPLDFEDNIVNANTVEPIVEDVYRNGQLVFRAGEVLVCWRNLDLVGTIDPASRRFTWVWGFDELEHPHHPSLLPNGNLLIFDNGKYRGFSRIVELEPLRGEIVWEYRAEPPQAFFSESRGAAQRLPNGNTLITESTRGRVFEVTPDGDVVWDFFEREMRERAFGRVERATIYRMMRVPEGTFAAASEGRPRRGPAPPATASASTPDSSAAQ